MRSSSARDRSAACVRWRTRARAPGWHCSKPAPGRPGGWRENGCIRPAVQMLRSVGIRLDARFGSRGLGFVVIAEDGLEPIELPYPDGSSGLVCEHAALVSRLHEAVGKRARTSIFFLGARVSEVEDGGVAYVRNGSRERLVAARVVGADGRALGGAPISGTANTADDLLADGGDHPGRDAPGAKGFRACAARRAGPDACVSACGASRQDSRRRPRWSSGRPGSGSACWPTPTPACCRKTLRAAFVEALRAGKFHAAANAMRAASYLRTSRQGAHWRCGGTLPTR